MVEVGEICQECRWWDFRTLTCDYAVYNNRSRMIVDGKITDPKYCNKFEVGERGTKDEAKKRHKFMCDNLYLK